MGWAVRRKAEGSGEDAHGIARSGRRWSASRAGRGPLVSRRGISHRAYPPTPTAHKEQETTPPQNQEAGDRGFREPNGKGWKTDFGPTPHAQTEELRPQEGETQRSSWPGWGVSPPLKGCAGQVLGYLLPPLSLPQPPALPSPSSAFTVAPVPTSGEVPVSPLPSGTPLSKCWLHPWVERGGALGSLSGCLDWGGRWERVRRPRGQWLGASLRPRVWVPPASKEASHLCVGNDNNITKESNSPLPRRRAPVPRPTGSSSSLSSPALALKPQLQPH